MPEKLPYPSVHIDGRPIDPQAAVTRPVVPKVDPESPTYGPIILEKLEAVLSAQSNTADAIGQFGSRMTNFEARLDSVVGRVVVLETGSNRKYSGEIEAATGEAKRASQHSAENAAAIAQVVGDVNELKRDMGSMKTMNAEQLAILRKAFTEAQTRLDEWTKKLTAFWNCTPMRIVRWVVGAGLVGWAAKNNIHLGSP